MTNEKSRSNAASLNTLKEYLNISIEPDVQLPDTEEIHLDQCLSRLFDIDHVPVIIDCTLLSVSSFSNATSVNHQSNRMSHYLQIRQPLRFYWMRNIKQMFLNIRLPSNETEQITANLVEFHSCKRIPYSARSMVHLVKPILLIYRVEERFLQLNIRASNSLLQLIFPSFANEDKQLTKGNYYKWSDEGHVRSTTIQFNIDYHVHDDHHLI